MCNNYINSNFQTITSGVAQGSTVGSILFNIFFNYFFFFQCNVANNFVSIIEFESRLVINWLRDNEYDC